MLFLPQIERALQTLGEKEEFEKSTYTQQQSQVQVSERGQSKDSNSYSYPSKQCQLYITIRTNVCVASAAHFASHSYSRLLVSTCVRNIISSVIEQA